ncbi:MAG: MATE family efflux transporter [Muribaculaceae bacterium]|nr:MATE family efflux transporter [Muribaculaceae bacterium]
MPSSSSSAKTSSSRTGASPNELGSRPIGKLLVQYSLPAIIASLVTSLYNIVDSIFIGRGVGAMAISGLAITFPLMNLVVAFCVLISAGGSTISSIFLGQKNIDKATDTVNNVMLMCLVHAAVIGSLCFIFLDEILCFFGATEETLPYARDFMQVILLGTPISYVFIGLNNLMRATGYPAKAMVSAILSVVVNVVLAPLFIFKFGWGIRGAATATIIGQLSAFVWVMAHFLSKKSAVRLQWHRTWFSPRLLQRIYGIGMSPFLMNCCACLVVVFINKSLLDAAGADGNTAIGAYGIINRTTMFFIMVIFGITQGMQPILGYNYGAGNWKRVKGTLGRGIWIGAAISTLGCVGCELLPDSISHMFTDDGPMVKIAREGFRAYFIGFPVVGVQIVIQNYFQSLGKPKLSIFLSLTRQLLFLVPLLWLLGRLYGIYGVWYSMALSDLLAGLLAIGTILYMNPRLERQINSTSYDTED